MRMCKIVVLLVLAVGLVGFSAVSTLAQAQFSPNQELPLPMTAGDLPVKFIVRGLEPSNRVDQDGTVYVSSIRGVPGGIDMHRWSPLLEGPPNPDGTLPFKYLGQPDGCGILSIGCSFIGIAEGGGDTDIAVNYPSLGLTPNLAVTSQTIVPGETSFHSGDRGESFSEPNPISNPLVGEDREWMDAIDGQTVYMGVHDAATFNINVSRSVDGGQLYFDGYGQAIDPQTYPAAGGIPATNTANVAGTLRVDNSSCPSRGNVYSVFVAPDNAVENATGQTFRSVYVAASTDAKLALPVYTFSDRKVFSQPVGLSAENLFPAMAVDYSGVLYALWSNNSDVLLSVSKDQANTWAAPVRVNQGATIGMANVFPWIAADANGHVGIVWYGSDRAGNSNDIAIHEPCPAGSTDCMKNWTNWNVYYAESVNASSATPLFTQTKVSDHAIHRGTVSTGGLNGNANRGLADYFQVSFDPLHRANIAFSDDSKVHPLGPNNGPDNPSTRRLTRVNFTRQLATAAGIKTKSACAGGRPDPGPKTTGSGSIGGRTKFGVIAKASPINASLRYDDGDSSLSARSSNGANSVSFSGSCATVTGDAVVNDQHGYTYRVDACDVADPGTGKDTFAIELRGPNYSYHRDGTLSKGEVQYRSQ